MNTGTGQQCQCLAQEAQTKEARDVGPWGLGLIYRWESEYPSTGQRNAPPSVPVPISEQLFPLWQVSGPAACLGPGRWLNSSLRRGLVSLVDPSGASRVYTKENTRANILEGTFSGDAVNHVRGLKPLWVGGAGIRTLGY